MLRLTHETRPPRSRGGTDIPSMPRNGTAEWAGVHGNNRESGSSSDTLGAVSEKMRPRTPEDVDVIDAGPEYVQHRPAVFNPQPQVVLQQQQQQPPPPAPQVERQPESSLSSQSESEPEPPIAPPKPREYTRPVPGVGTHTAQSYMRPLPGKILPPKTPDFTNPFSRWSRKAERAPSPEIPPPVPAREPSPPRAANPYPTGYQTGSSSYSETESSESSAHSISRFPSPPISASSRVPSAQSTPKIAVMPLSPRARRNSPPKPYAETAPQSLLSPPQSDLSNPQSVPSERFSPSRPGARNGGARSTSGEPIHLFNPYPHTPASPRRNNTEPTQMFHSYPSGPSQTDVSTAPSSPPARSENHWGTAGSLLGQYRDSYSSPSVQIVQPSHPPPVSTNGGSERHNRRPQSSGGPSSEPFSVTNIEELGRAALERSKKEKAARPSVPINITITTRKKVPRPSASRRTSARSTDGKIVVYDSEPERGNFRDSPPTSSRKAYSTQSGRNGSRTSLDAPPPVPKMKHALPVPGFGYDESV